MLIKNIKPIKPEKSLCISVSSPNKLFAVGSKGTLLTHNSVSQQNIIFSCIMRPKDWVILGIDLKRVELSRYRKFGMKVATELGPALDFLRFAQAVMMKRYERLEEVGENNFRDLAVPGQALLVMIDEAGELLSPTGAKTDEAKEADELKGEAKMIIGSIARLGRASGVHLVIATQRPDAELIPGETRDNLAVRVGCGTLKPSASQMLFQSNDGARTPSNPPGGIFIQIHGSGNRGQGFFAPNDWLEKYYERNPHEKPDGEIEGADFEEIPDSTSSKETKISHLDDWDDDMESIISAGEE